MKYSYIEPGLLQVFRLFIGAEWLLLAFAGCAEATERRSQFLTVFMLTVTSILMAYLLGARLQERMGHCYLPVALGIASVGPVIGFAGATAAQMAHGVQGNDALVEPGTLLLWLLLPLVLVSAQYRMRTLLAFNFGIGFLQIILALPLMLAGGPRLQLTIQAASLQIILFTIIGYIIVRLMAGQRTQRTALADANTQLAQNAAMLEQLAVSRERNRMARELHDTLAHTLSATAVQLEALSILLDSDIDAARDTLSSTLNLTRSGLGEARRALVSLRASPLEDLGVALAIRNLAESAAQRARLTLDLDVVDHIPNLRPDIEHNLYRIAEEALNNVVRHANAHHLRVSLHAENAIQLTISDDGRGFDPALAAEDGRFGLTGMRERAQLCGGQLSLQSAPDEGTTLQVMIGNQA